MKTHKALRDVSASTVSAFTPRRKSTGSWWTQGPRTLSGCAHNGILNILDRYRELYGSDPDAVISGFHMSRKPHYSQADLELVRQTGEELRRLPIRFCTGHCTGEPHQSLPRKPPQYVRTQLPFRTKWSSPFWSRFCALMRVESETKTMFL